MKIENFRIVDWIKHRLYYVLNIILLKFNQIKLIVKDTSTSSLGFNIVLSRRGFQLTHFNYLFIYQEVILIIH